MKTIFKRTLQLAALVLVLGLISAKKAEKPSYQISNVPFTSVKVAPETFWGDRIRQSREVTIPLAFSKCEETDRYTNFKNAAAKMAETARGDNSSNYRPTQFPFDDTDVYKTIEGKTSLFFSINLFNQDAVGLIICLVSFKYNEIPPISG